MIFAVDVSYDNNKAIAAGVLFQQWEDDASSGELVIEREAIFEYEPGQFYKRELPCLIQLLGQLKQSPEYIIVDGYVHLGIEQRPGLGRHLYNALDGQVVIIGVAKSRFQNTPTEAEVLRGNSKRPLYVTAVGIDQAEAKSRIMQMHGIYRVPTLLKRVDQLTRL
jgi:deoxyribonuclease V